MYKSLRRFILLARDRAENGEKTMITIKIKTDNAAFQDDNFGTEVARILRDIADDFANNGSSQTSYNDINGNKVATLS